MRSEKRKQTEMGRASMGEQDVRDAAVGVRTIVNMLICESATTVGSSTGGRRHIRVSFTVPRASRHINKPGARRQRRR